MAKIDLHVHSKYSEHPSDWFLQRLGARESYTEPEFIYKTAKDRGMNFVTITDHNQIDGALMLKAKYPDDVIVGVETTTYFPEDGCKIHILIYGITEKEFNEIQKIRKNIYELRDYIKFNEIAYSVAHATFSINNKLNVEHLEKLILMFDVFEGINGGRNYLFNHKWMEILKRLTPSHVDNLYKKHGIEPIGNDPWIKGFTAGSDDHAGLFMGNTYTETDADDIDEIIENLKNKKTCAKGNHNNYKSLAFTIYKVAFEFAKNKNKTSNSLIFQLSEKVFESDSFNIKEKFKIRRMKSSNKKNGDRIGQLMTEIMDEIKSIRLSQIDKRLEIVFNKVCDISDEFFKKILKSSQEDISNGDLVSIIMKLSSSLPGIFLSLPFLSTLKLMYNNRELINEIKNNLSIELPESEKRILWFTDTINDLNGVSETLKELGWISYRKNQKIQIVTSLLKNEMDKTIPPNTISLPTIFTFNLPYYEDYILKFPSILKSIEILSKKEPTEIYISTPGPIGLLGLLMAKLLNVKCSGIYHTDFTLEIDKIADDNMLTELVESYTKWFYSMMDSIKVLTKEYFNLLANRGFDKTKMQMIGKGIDTNLFSFNKNGRLAKFNIKAGINLLYVGRISKDKQLDFLAEIYRHLSAKRNDVNLLIVGDGPYFNALKSKMKMFEQVYFTGRIPRENLPEIYSYSDILVFPSTTDTFGMVVMEAQSCELPSIVSDVGGPQEILIAGKTGLIAKNNNLNDWIQKIETLIEMKEERETDYTKMKKDARENILKRFGWERSWQGILELSN